MTIVLAGILVLEIVLGLLDRRLSRERAKGEEAWAQSLKEFARERDQAVASARRWKGAARVFWKRSRVLGQLASGRPSRAPAPTMGDASALALAGAQDPPDDTATQIVAGPRADHRLHMAELADPQPITLGFEEPLYVPLCPATGRVRWTMDRGTFDRAGLAACADCKAKMAGAT